MKTSSSKWLKAAYHKNDGVTANYWDYATGSNTIPTNVISGTDPGTAVFNGPNPDPSDPADISLAGGLSPYGTMGQNGNVYEWDESAYTAPNDSSSEFRAFRGGYWLNSESFLRSSVRGGYSPPFESSNLGFRVASVPEPTAAVLVLMAGGAWLLKRRRKSSL